MANIVDNDINGDNDRHAHFSISVASSRSSSPVLSLNDEKKTSHTTKSGAFLHPLKVECPPGRQAADIYDMTLPRWRAALRRRLVASVHTESRILANMQNAIRTPWLDTYFVYTSTLGTHTFFMIGLPTFFFFGYDETGKGLLFILAFGVYFASFVKDLLCSPRPFAPPVTRLTIGSHHLEYGFPSTHSTNSVSIALLLWERIYMLSTASDHSPAVLSPLVYKVLTGILIWYSFSIVYGRLYTGMHSFSDCIMGVALGTGIWWAYTDFPGICYTLPAFLTSSSTFTVPKSVYLLRGLNVGNVVDNWARTGGWKVPLTIIPLGLLAVNQHPQPVDDCPCFEDAIAFGSVVAGALLGNWMGLRSKIATDVIMPGSGWSPVDFNFTTHSFIWEQTERGWDDVLLWWAIAAVKMALGILVIFLWRIVAKSTLHLVLPPLFRFLARIFSLPNRRFYIPATDYKGVPGLEGLRPIPSMIDLSMESLGVEVGGIGSGSGSDYDTIVRGKKGKRSIDIKVRGEKGKRVNANPSPPNSYSDTINGDGKAIVKHYDADVLTKVIVYAGIAVLGRELIPVLFDLIGLGVYSWPRS